MPTCDQCGDEIEFRYMDGRPTPIHVNGGWCLGYNSQKPAAASGWFRSTEAFTDPNALCPVCGASVFYYQNLSGSRVFFDDLGWPWPKHPCTDNPASQTPKIRRPAKSGLRGKLIPANQANLYELVDSGENDDIFSVKFRNIANRLLIMTLRLPAADLKSQGWTEADLKDAPSFIIRRQPEQTLVEFLSVRRSMIGRLIFPRVAGPN